MTSVASWQQTSLLDDLLTTIENDPTSINARQLLIEQYEALGWDDAAANEARNCIELFPNAPETKQLIDRYGSKVASKPAKGKKKVARKSANFYPFKRELSSRDVQQLGKEFKELQEDAKSLLRDLSVLADLAPEIDCADRLAELTALSEGRMFSVVRGRCGKSARPSTSTVRSARAVAASMKDNPKSALEIALSDLEVVMNRTPSTDNSDKAKDARREALRKRVDTIKNALPPDIAYLASDALMHIEHEKLGKTYKNGETMLGDPIADIARADFFCSEDGYAWDMDELVQAIRAAKGAMRNPLTKESFSTDDVTAIIRHPKGKALAALEVEQNELRKGVRAETISRLRTMSKVLLDDMSENSLPSHAAIDDFLLYVATLPTPEQKAIEKLRVPAVDSHTGMAFEDTVGEAVRDAKGNRICFHKAGDLLKQAAEFLEGLGKG